MNERSALCVLFYLDLRIFHSENFFLAAAVILHSSEAARQEAVARREFFAPVECSPEVAETRGMPPETSRTRLSESEYTVLFFP